MPAENISSLSQTEAVLMPEAVTTAEHDHLVSVFGKGGKGKVVGFFGGTLGDTIPGISAMKIVQDQGYSVQALLTKDSYSGAFAQEMDVPFVSLSFSFQEILGKMGDLGMFEHVLPMFTKGGKLIDPASLTQSLTETLALFAGIKADLGESGFIVAAHNYIPDLLFGKAINSAVTAEMLMSANVFTDPGVQGTNFEVLKIPHAPQVSTVLNKALLKMLSGQLDGQLGRKSWANVAAEAKIGLQGSKYRPAHLSSMYFQSPLSMRATGANFVGYPFQEKFRPLPEETKNWLQEKRDQGIEICLVSTGSIPTKWEQMIEMTSKIAHEPERKRAMLYLGGWRSDSQQLADPLLHFANGVVDYSALTEYVSTVVGAGGVGMTAYFAAAGIPIIWATVFPDQASVAKIQQAQLQRVTGDMRLKTSAITSNKFNYDWLLEQMSYVDQPYVRAAYKAYASWLKQFNTPEMIVNTFEQSLLRAFPIQHK